MRSINYFLALLVCSSIVLADGKVMPPRNYKGSLEERAQEAVIIFHEPTANSKSAVEDLILKITVEGDVDHFAWIIPFPNKPKVEKEDAKIFEELFRYVELRNRRPRKEESLTEVDKSKAPQAGAANAVKVLSREVVGNFDVAIVAENEQGGLNPWLEKEGFQKLEGADDTIEFYRQKKYVFACIKVARDKKSSGKRFDSHPLRFTFETGGRDGVFFPMKLTGLQTEPFDVNLYVFYRYWLNDKLSPFGYMHRGFRRRYRDWDTRECIPNGGKSYSLPSEDPFLRDMANRLPVTKKLFQKLYPGDKFYLTNIYARRLQPAEVRQWADDLWMFPYYTDRSMIPLDAREGGPAHLGYQNIRIGSSESSSSEQNVISTSLLSDIPRGILAVVAAILVLVGIATTSIVRTRLKSKQLSKRVSLKSEW